MASISPSKVSWPEQPAIYPSLVTLDGAASSEEAEDGGPTTIGEHQSEPRWRRYNAPRAQEWQGSKLTDAVGLNVLGFMNKRHELDAYTFEGTVDSAVVIGCFDQFCKVMQGPTVVVMDNASIHTS